MLSLRGRCWLDALTFNLVKAARKGGFFLLEARGKWSHPIITYL